ncbi:carboxypeptidase-like regulatory domain-containing protein [Chryseobacterium gambrini]|uniref:Carboxypeptidase-like regulatory domain-containing protein n=2 Tax=Chryseobacterium TaxID=59732 RepID=A0AAJ1R074_9FLAO|nr:carboxypeptidase-like regulatory domain-containing protein [Chryseobacterium gambrini]MDN4011156.1 carboxypeptidase-like regulatory domain-containing protein [Chryseobacterium gambrini]MDN4030986.1 carboxypeptidase-like regulatory domain-containing protein [Chryseobacterium gambrini]
MRKFYLLFLLLSLIFSCKDESFMEIDNNTSNPQSNYNFGNDVQKNFQGVVLDINGAPVSGAAVTIGTATVTTNLKGFFTFKNASVKENFAHVKVTKAGFVNASRVLVPTNGMNRINIMMIPAATTSTISSGSSSTVSLPNGTKVKFDGSFKDANGNAYTGSVKVALFNLASSNPYLNELMPGSLLATNSGGNARVMETFGMVHVQLTGSSGQNLQIANGHTAEITVPIDASQTSSSPATIPLWSYNEQTGMWNEEGSATKVGNTYVGTVSHFSWWNCDAQFQQATMKVTVKNTAGQVLPNIKVTLKRASQTYETYGITDNMGMVSGIVPANEVLNLKVYDICNNVIYTSNVGPFPAGVITTIADITINPSASTSYTIQGNLKTCANTDVTDGYVILRNAAGTNYFNYLSVPVNANGSFTMSTYSCTSNPQFIYEGFDVANLQTTGEVTFTATTNTVNLGNITVCNSVSEFVSYKIDNQAVTYVLGSFNAQWSGLTSPTPNLPSKQLRINSVNPAGPYFSMTQNNMMGVAASFTTDYMFELSGAVITPSNGNLIVNISTFGVVGDYIDFTVNGTYTNTTGSHTFTATGHVKRDM